MATKLPEVKVTNSLGGKKETLVPKEPGKITMYSCGPTVYGPIHVGNLRAATTSDLIFRTLQKLGYDVTYVRNYTDVDDKIIDEAKKQGMTPEDLAKKYTQAVERDYAAAGLLEPTHKTTVTGHIKEIITLIENILKNGKGYTVDEGNGRQEVFFSIKDFPTYGKLSRKNLDDLIAGARVEVNAKKKNAADFSLWKPAKPGEPYWDSPWGPGRPGWHIECSAMASKWLGDQIDLHHGGTDLIFPHHENEIAQSEAASGKAPYVKYWAHNAMLNINSEKMSKSLGNFVTAHDFLAMFGGEVTRMMFIATHYRSIADFGEEAVEGALSGLQRLYEAKLKAESLTKLRAASPHSRAEALWGEFMMDCQKARTEIAENMANDFNSPGAIAVLFTLIRAFNRVTSETGAEVTPSAVLGSQELIRIIEDEIGGFLGVGRKSAQAGLDSIGEIRSKRYAESAPAGAKLSKDEIERMIQARADAKKSKNFAEADRIRKELTDKGVAIKDSPTGTTWEYT